jgi:hypothetical protein
MTDPAEGSHPQSAAFASGTEQAFFSPATRKVWKSPKVITSAMSGANHATVNATTFDDGHVSYTS